MPCLAIRQIRTRPPDPASPPPRVPQATGVLRTPGFYARWNRAGSGFCLRPTEIPALRFPAFASSGSIENTLVAKPDRRVLNRVPVGVEEFRSAEYSVPRQECRSSGIPVVQEHSAARPAELAESIP